MHSDLASIKHDFEHDKEMKEEELIELKDQQEETALSKLFQHQSEEVQSLLKSKQREGLKNAMQKNLKNYLEH